MGLLNYSVVIAVTAVLVGWLPKLLEKRLPPNGEGFAAPGWRRVADVFRLGDKLINESVSLWVNAVSWYLYIYSSGGRRVIIT